MNPLKPDDAFNRATSEIVRPEIWPVRPQPHYELVAVGGGTAGLVASGAAAAMGARTAVVERARLGGDCLIGGCVPSKAILHAARVAHDARNGARFGVHADPEVDFAGVMRRLREIRSEIAHDDGAEATRRRGVDVVFGAARFTSSNTLVVDGREVRFDRAVVATGGRPRVPRGPGFADHARTSDTIFELTVRPRHLLVVGGGPIGCELAQAFRRLGSGVTLCQRGPRLLPADDPDASGLVLETLLEEGVEVRLGCEVVALGPSQATLRSRGREEQVSADEVLLAVGRVPNVEGLGLEAAGVEYGPHGIGVDAGQRTSSRRIYAAGDVTTGPKFTHAAYAQGEDAAVNALTPLRRRSGRRVMSWCTFTDPEVAHAGLDLRSLAVCDTESLTLGLEDNDRMRLDGEARGFARVHLDRRSRKVLAATFVGRNAGELVAELGLIISQGLGLDAVSRVIHAYPTRSWLTTYLAREEGLRRVGPTTRRLLGWWRALLR